MFKHFEKVQSDERTDIRGNNNIPKLSLERAGITTALKKTLNKSPRKCELSKLTNMKVVLM